MDVLFDFARGNVALGIEELVDLGQEDVADQPDDFLGLVGDRCRLGVRHDVLNTILDSPDRCLPVLCHARLGQSLFGVPQVADLVDDGIVEVCQTVSLVSSVGEFQVCQVSHNDGEVARQHFNKNPSRTLGFFWDSSRLFG